MKAQFVLVACLLTGLTLTARPDHPLPSDADMTLYSRVLGDFELRIQLANLQQKTTLVQLATLQGETFYVDRVVRHNGYARKFDLSKLPKGRYILTVSQNDKQMSLVIVKKWDQLMISQARELS